MSKKCIYTVPEKHSSVSLQVAGCLGQIAGRPALFGMGAVSDLDNLIGTVEHEGTPFSSGLLRVLKALKKDYSCEQIQFITERVDPTNDVSMALLIHPTKKLIEKVGKMPALTDIFVVLYRAEEVSWLAHWSTTEATIPSPST